MAFEIIIENEDDFEELVNQKDIRIANALVETIFKNLKSKKRHHHALSVKCLETGIAYDITIDRLDFEENLKEILPRYETLEEFETCQKIKESIDYLDKIK
jgi:hypothetical protein